MDLFFNKNGMCNTMIERLMANRHEIHRFLVMKELIEYFLLWFLWCCSLLELFLPLFTSFSFVDVSLTAAVASIYLAPIWFVSSRADQFPQDLTMAATRIAPGVGANLIGQHAQERNQEATVYVGNLDFQVRWRGFSNACLFSCCNSRPLL